MFASTYMWNLKTKTTKLIEKKINQTCKQRWELRGGEVGGMQTKGRSFQTQDTEALGVSWQHDDYS